MSFRRSNTKNRGPPPRRSLVDEELFPFHTLVPITGAGQTLISVNPNNTLTPRGSVEADSWAHFQCRKLKFRMHPCGIVPVAAVTTANVSVGYCGGIQDTPPASASQVLELHPSTFLSKTQTLPTAWVTVPSIDLRGPLPWYKAISGTADSTEEAPGQICVFTTDATNGMFTNQLEVKGVFAFKTSVATGNTPAAVAARLTLHEERKKAADKDESERLFSLLAPMLPRLFSQTALGRGVTPSDGKMF